MCSKTNILQQNWYYRIEYENGQYTSGHGFKNFALTRGLMANVQVHSQSCLDIGTQEGVVPILLSRREPKCVVAYDRKNLQQKIDFLQNLYKAEFHYLAGFNIDELPERLVGFGRRYYDFVVFSGVLYHMINPFGHLILVSSLCKKGGLFLLETAAIQDNEEKLLFNAGAKLMGKYANYFLPTTAWLDYALRMVGMNPLYACYAGKLEGKAVNRVAILCKREAEPCPLEETDEWVYSKAHERVFQNEAGLDWQALKNTASTISFTPYDERFVFLNGRDIYSALGEAAPFPVEPADLQLSLGDMV